MGNLTPYINESIKLDITGPAIIGPSEPTLIGGCIESMCALLASPVRLVDRAFESVCPAELPFECSSRTRR